VLIRCNAGQHVGFGHVSRCLSLALALRDRGAEVRFILGSADAVPRVEGRGFPAEDLPADDNGEAFAVEVERLRPDVLVLDARPVYSLDFVREIKKHTKRLVLLDDISEQRWAADQIYLPPTPSVLALDWQGFTGEKFIGIEWMLLGDTFHPCAPCPPRIPFRLLATMGGSDPWGYMDRLAAPMAQACRELGMHLGLVVGPGFRERQRQIDFYQTLGKHVRVFDAPQSMTEVYGWCDAAVTVFCVSAYELAACGKPALYICPDRDYREHASVFEELGYGQVVLLPSSTAEVSSAVFRACRTARLLKQPQAGDTKIGGAAKRIARLIFPDGNNMGALV
jgi:spore coat polysaccharide biosynthesis protein SpsF